MRTFIPLNKICLLLIVLLTSFMLTTCDLSKKEDDTTTQHCTLDSQTVREFEMSSDNFYYTTSYSLVGNNEILEYSTYYNQICPTKPITLNFSCYVKYTSQIQVTASASWGSGAYDRLNFPLSVNYNTVGGTNSYSYIGNLDLSLYSFPENGAIVTVKVDFQFATTGSTASDQGYLKSNFVEFDFHTTYYPW